MGKLYKKVKRGVGLPPGTISAGESADQKPAITVFDYDAENFTEKKMQEVRECFPFKDSKTITWINIEGIASDMVKEIGEHYGVHPLVCEDIIHTGQRPKLEDYEDHIFIVLKMIYFNEKLNEIVDEQISLILGPGFVISIQEKEGDVFDPIRRRIREGKGRVRAMEADYLAYALLDAVVDNYYIILEKRGDEIEELEENIISNPHNEIGRDIHRLKRDMIYLRKQIWPLREVINAFERNESSLVKKHTGVYLRDVYDHVIQVMDTVESFRDLLSGMHDSYLSAISNKMNEVMKVLTIFAAIFIPLTFMAGIYGMNFKYMPELDFRYGYFILLGIMVVIGFGMLFYFKKKKWL